MNTDERDSKRVKFAESRGQESQGEDVEELEANAEEQHLDADVEAPAHKILQDRRCRRGCGSRSPRTDADAGQVHERLCIQQDRSV